MANSFYISFAPDLDALDTKLTIVDTVVDQIRYIDVPNIQSNIDSNETKIDIIDTVVDAVKLKTDATPQSVRGKIYKAQLSTQNAGFVEVANITGHGKIVNLIHSNQDAAVTCEIRLTVDGIVYTVFSYTGDTNGYWLFHAGDSRNDVFSLINLINTSPSSNQINLEFEASFILELRKSAGGAFDVHCKVFYTLDTF